MGDIDLIAVKGDIPIAVISCKTSLHGRFTETLFWSLLFRLLTKVKVVLVTSDTGSGEKGALRTEWGTPENPNQNRLLAEAFLDRVYVENVSEFCPELIEPTVFGGVVRPLSELPEDLKRWADEISKVTYLRRSKPNEFI
ncbi:MAG: BsaWI family type II restriction enzyme [Candidatus Jordarchaeaceae archaeon]